jgi:hypothetical protein
VIGCVSWDAFTSSGWILTGEPFPICEEVHKSRFAGALI